MKKQDFFDLMDPVSMVCVNPYDVNPITQNTMLPSPRLAADVPFQDNCGILNQQNLDMLNGGGFYEPPRQKIKMEMEEFKDLSLYLPVTIQKPMSMASADELNTPTFDKNKDAFDFDLYAGKYSKSEETQKADCEEYYDINNLINKNYFKNYVTGNVSAKETTINYIDNNTVSPLDNEVVYQTNQSDSGSPIYNQNTSYMDESALDPQSYGQYTYVASPGNEMQQYRNMPPTPEGSSSECSGQSPERPRIILDVNASPSTEISALSTPEVLEEVANLETVNFNILDLVKNEDITILDADNELLGAIAENTSETKPNFGYPNTSITVQTKKPRKRKSETDDDDEDYVPPTKNKTVSARRKVVSYDSDSDSDGDAFKKKKPRLRGRPPKRTESVSSDCSKDSDVSKYRELRDKNNEASRKSRLKRKMKELEYEREANDLYTKNIKLKAQVEELEKMVNNFRNNLFKIMIKK